jgi:hypothetical protein
MAKKINDVERESPRRQTASPARMLRGEEFLGCADAGEQIVSLACTGATDEEIADYLELPVSIISGTFEKQLKRGRASMRIGLRKKQLQAATADDGEVRLLQFLGKHYLAQADSTGETDREPVKTYHNVRMEDV